MVSGRYLDLSSKVDAIEKRGINVKSYHRQINCTQYYHVGLPYIVMNRNYYVHSCCVTYNIIISIGMRIKVFCVHYVFVVGGSVCGVMTFVDVTPFLHITENQNLQTTDEMWKKPRWLDNIAWHIFRSDSTLVYRGILLALRTVAFIPTTTRQYIYYGICYTESYRKYNIFRCIYINITNFTILRTVCVLQAYYIICIHSKSLTDRMILFNPLVK